MALLVIVQNELVLTCDEFSTVVVENSGSFPLSNNTLRSGDDFTLLFMVETGIEFEVLDRTVFRNISEVFVVAVEVLKLLAELNVKGVEVVVIPLTVVLLILCCVNILAGSISRTGVPVVVVRPEPECC